MNIGKKFKSLSLIVVVAVTLAACTPSSKARGEMMELSDATVAMQNFTASATLKVNSVTLDFYPDAAVLSDPKDEGRQFISVEVTVENTGEENFSLNFTSFHLDTAAEKGVTETFLLNESNVTDHLESVDLAVGESATGKLYFEVAGDEDLSTMSLVYEGYNEDIEDVEGIVEFE